jgi:hypothetical protein
MKTEKLTDNELIAEFHNGITFDESGLCTDPEQKYSWRPGCIDPLRVEHLQYHNNWSHLMPVCTKALKSINKFIERGRSSDSISTHDWGQAKRFKSTIETTLIGGDIKKLHNRIVEFIKWYNQNKP